MHRQKTNQESKLRAACDRCHELKNRCVRTGGNESRCDRCERLDIDCVYRNTSRIGRPKAQTNGKTIANANRTTAMSENGNTTLNEPQSDLTSFLVSPEVVQQVDMDWGHIDFSQHIDPINESLDQGATASLPAFDSFAPESGASLNTEDRLLQLQGQVHRLLSAMDRQPEVNYVEEGLEVTKSFLEILQASVDSHSQNLSNLSTTSALPPGSNGSANGAGTTSNCFGGNIMNSDHSSKLHAATGVHSIMVEQALLCYSYVLHMLDRVVGVLAANVNQTGGGELEPTAALSFGFFSLASQPLLNAEVLMHIVSRMVQHLRTLIQQLASRCKDLTDRSASPPDSAIDIRSPWTTPTSSIAATSYNVGNLVCEREKLLIERLSSSTSSL